MQGKIEAWKLIVTTLITSAFGSAGVVGLLFWWFKMQIEQKLNVAQKQKNDQDDMRTKRYEMSDAYDHALGRVLFWLIHGVKKLDPNHTFFNGELQEAFEKLTECEDERKELDRKQLAEINRE